MDAIECKKAVAVWLAVALLFSTVLAACGSGLEVGVETTPTTDVAATATVSALATENAHLATQVATLAVPTPTPTPSLGKLAYVQGGDIWVKALPDGAPQRLTTDGRNREPRWSPSGEWLAFRKGEFKQVWVMRADGSDARSLMAVPDGAFAWAPSDDRLAYAASGGLQVISADSATPTTLVPDSLPGHGPGWMGHITWSPNGAWITCEWQEWQPKQPLTYQGLWRVSSDGEQLAELYASGAPEKGEAILASWSLDGQHILFWQGDILSASMLAGGVALYSLPAGGGKPTKLMDTVLVHDDFLALAPQGDRLAVTAGGYRATWTNKRVAVVGAGGGELVWLTDESVAAFSPAWSPDGVHLAYVAMPDEGDLVGGEDARLGMMERHVWVVNVQGEPQPQQLTDDPACRDERPLWAADGSHLLFARMDAEDRASLWLIPAAGGEPRRVVDELTPLPGPAPGWFGYYGHVDWDQLFDWWRGPARAPAGVVVPTPGPSPTARPLVSPTPVPSPPTPAPTTVLTATRTYTDTALGFAIDYPAAWDVDGVQGAFAWLSNPATSGEERQAINIAALAEPSLEAMLDNVERGSFGPYMISAEPVQLGGLEALKVTLRQAPEGLSLLWLVITPQSWQQGQGLTIAAYGDPALAEAIVATWRPISPAEAHDLDSARQALMAYLFLLHEQRYSEAINYYGGTYDILRNWNPTVAQDDYATLFKNGCTMNGLKCLSIRTIVCEEEVSPTEFRFTVEFTNDNGSLFVLGPCCGATETEMPPQTQFVYTVKRVEDRFLIQDLPVYVP